MHSLIAVSYLNTKPFLEGLAGEFSPEELTVRWAPPAQCAEAYLAGQADVALVPAAALLQVSGAEVLPDFCIGADGRVDSVLLFSQVPPEQVQQVQLDPHSRTSNGLVQVLYRHLWHREPHFSPSPLPPEPFTGRLVIGDAAMSLAHAGQYAYVTDLAQAWHALTGLPFVFAVWVCRPRRTDAALRARLMRAFSRGLAQRGQVAQRWASHFGMTVPEAENYLLHAIDYRLDAPKRQALEHYLGLLAQLQNTPSPVLNYAAC